MAFANRRKRRQRIHGTNGEEGICRTSETISQQAVETAPNAEIFLDQVTPVEVNSSGEGRRQQSDHFVARVVKSGKNTIGRGSGEGWNVTSLHEHRDVLG